MLHKAIRWGLGLHGTFHILEFGMNIYEGAYMSSLITLLSALLMLSGAFIDYQHHKKEKPMDTWESRVYSAVDTVPTKDLKRIVRLTLNGDIESICSVATVVEATDGKDFQSYAYKKDGSRVKEDTVVGVEILSEEGNWKLYLCSDIELANFKGVNNA